MSDSGSSQGLLYEHNPHHPNHVQTFAHAHIPTPRKSTNPAGCQPAEIFARPCMPGRISASSLGTETRAKKTRLSNSAVLTGLMTLTAPLNLRVGKLSSLTATF